MRCPDKLVWEDTVKWVQHIRKSIFHREPLLQRFLQITDAELTLFDENLEASSPEITSALSQVQK